jgi:hypothetical protein
MFDRAIRWYVAMNVLFHSQTKIGLQKTEGGIYTQVFLHLTPPILHMMICGPMRIAT